MGINRKQDTLTFDRIQRKTPLLKSALKSNQSSSCGLHSSRDKKEDDQMARSRAYGVGRDLGRLLEKKTGPRKALCTKSRRTQKKQPFHFVNQRKRASQKDEVR